MELFEDTHLLCGRNAGTRVGHSHVEAPVYRFRRDKHLASVGELDGVADEIKEHLGQTLLIAEANGEGLRHLGLERELLVLCQRLCGRTYRLDHALDGVFANVQGELAGFDLGDVEHRIDEAQQVLAVGADPGEGVERFRSLRLVEAFLDEFGIAENGRKRGSELVAHVGHELVLVLARDLKVLDSFGKFTCPRLDFFEQARVFNRDYGLVGEGLKERYLSVCEWANLGAPNGNYTDRLARTDQWHGQYSAEAKASGVVASFWELISIGQQIGDVDRSPVEKGTSGDYPTRQRQCNGSWDWPMVSDEAENVTVHLMDRRIISVANMYCACGHRRKHAPEVRRRARDQS